MLSEVNARRERWMTEREAAKLIMTARRRTQPMPKGASGSSRATSRASSWSGSTRAPGQRRSATLRYGPPSTEAMSTLSRASSTGGRVAPAKPRSCTVRLAPGQAARPHAAGGSGSASASIALSSGRVSRCYASQGLPAHCRGGWPGGRDPAHAALHRDHLGASAKHEEL